MRRYTPTIFIGLVAGLGLGLLYTWVISPVKYVDTAPASLRADYRSEYIQLVAHAFVVDGDVERARMRLAALGASDAARTVMAFTDQFAAAGGDAETLTALAALAHVLTVGPASPTPVPVTPTFTAAPTTIPVATPRPVSTPVPTATPVGVFQVSSRSVVCNGEAEGRLIQVVTLDASGAPVAGVEIMVESASGIDHFFTGLKPEVGPGYGDFTMLSGEVYTAYPANSPGAAVSDLSVPLCADGAPGSWRLEFRQP